MRRLMLVWGGSGSVFEKAPTPQQIPTRRMGSAFGGSMTDGSRKAIVAAFLANLAIAVSKFAAWFVTGAASMLAEGVHSLADTANQGLLLLGGARARRQADAEHIERVIHMRTLHVGPDQLLVGAKVELKPGLDVPAVAAAINAAEEAVRAAVPIVEFSYIEPDVHDPDRPQQRPEDGPEDP